MRKLKLQIQTSLDGFIAGPNHEMNWMQLPWTEDLIAYVRTITQPVDTILLGKNLAEGFIPYWKHVAQNPDNPDYEGAIKFTTTPLIVFSTTLKESKWENTSINNGDLKEEINVIKNKSGSDIIVYGGATLVANLIKEDLIDEYHIMINPTAIGKGLSIFSLLSENRKLKLLDSQKFDCGIVVLVYQKI